MDSFNIDKIVDNIASSIFTQAKHQISIGDHNDDFGLFNGHWGLLLFEAYYLRYNPKFDDKCIFNDHLQFCLDRLSEGYDVFNYCNGLSGILLTLKHLQDKQFVEIDTLEADDIFDDLLKRVLVSELRYSNFDFLHGIIGMGLYWLRRNNEIALKCLKYIIEGLEREVDIDDGQYKWKTILNTLGDKVYNICLAHGMCGIAIFLARVYQKGILKERTLKLLNGCINYILAQEIDHEKYGCFFPSISIAYDTNIKKSRMGWCYGDLGVALCLWQAGNILKNNVLIEKSLRIFEFSTLRKDLKENYVYDASLCHGTSGISQIFLRLYFETGIKDFLDAHQFWRAETLKMSGNIEGLAGYKTLDIKDGELGYFGSYNFLEGISGIGLSLMASEVNTEFSDWDDFLLLK